LKFTHTPGCQTALAWGIFFMNLKIILGILNMPFTETPTLPFDCREFLDFDPL